MVPMSSFVSSMLHWSSHDIKSPGQSPSPDRQGNETSVESSLPIPSRGHPSNEGVNDFDVGAVSIPPELNQVGVCPDLQHSTAICIAPGILGGHEVAARYQPQSRDRAPVILGSTTPCARRRHGTHPTCSASSRRATTAVSRSKTGCLQCHNRCSCSQVATTAPAALMPVRTWPNGLRLAIVVFEDSAHMFFVEEQERCVTTLGDFLAKHL